MSMMYLGVLTLENINIEVSPSQEYVHFMLPFLDFHGAKCLLIKSVNLSNQIIDFGDIKISPI